MKICTQCILPETFPGIQFNDEGVCNICLRAPKPETVKKHKTRYRQKFENLLKSIPRDRDYDCLVCYSGGKDSTFTLDILKNSYGLRILAFTLDNGFISPRARENIGSVVEKLDLDHIYFKPRFGLLRSIFAKAAEEVLYSEKSLERASTICTSCISFVKFPALKMAIEKSIPLMGYGWSPGQAPVQSSVMKTNPTLIRATQDTVLQPLQERFGNEVRTYFLEEEQFAKKDNFPVNVHPLAFLDYDEEKIHKQITELGWVQPDDTDPNSTNCLLNAFANEVHIKQFGYNPYVFEIANLVREGLHDRETSIRKFSEKPPDSLLDYARSRLNLR